MESTKPYLIRAIHEWCSDSGFTPYLAVTVDSMTRVPREFVKAGKIVLNVGLEATNQLMLGNEEISFQARFGGRAMTVNVPIARVSGIFAKENGEGMAFEVTETLAVEDSANSLTDSSSDASSVTTTPSTESPDGRNSASPSAQKPPGKPGRPVLTRVK